MSSAAPELKESEIKQIRRDADAVFSVIDIDGDGSISLDELTNHLKTSGYADDAIAKIFARLDVNNDGSISKEEFRDGLIAFSPLRSAPGLGNYNSQFVDEIHADADRLFSSCDADNNGSISREELKDYLSIVSKYSDRAIDNIFQNLDVNYDGEISKEELRDAFVKYSALRQAIGEGPNFK